VSLGLITHESDVRKLHRQSHWVGKTVMVRHGLDWGRSACTNGGRKYL